MVYNGNPIKMDNLEVPPFYETTISVILCVTSLVTMIWIPDTSVFPSEECKFCVTVANPQSEDSPLIAVSEEFETMTGFSRHEILGVNCRFLNPGVDMNPQDEAGNQNS